MQESSVLVLCPSFSSYTSMKFAEIADRVIQEFIYNVDDFGIKSLEEATEYGLLNDEKELETESSAEAAFEFAIVSKDQETLTVSADEIFSNGQIRPMFPITNKNDYGIWTMKEDYACHERSKKKSNSTGTSKQWRVRELISRSNSDSKETMVLLAPGSFLKKKEEKKIENKMLEVSNEKRSSDSGKVAKKVTIMKEGRSGQTVKSAHEIHYMRSRVSKEVDRRRTYLPYRTDVIGFFANRNGLSRKHHPF